MNQNKAGATGAESQTRTGQATDVVVMPRITSASLLGAHRSIEIAHGGHIYRLSQTLQGKLILTK